ncbi:TetR/AcrR family transcriptional regulator [Streptomyces sp. NPDC020875]|uniref:TetR/AcrR family transcriptional regulator n=1 Tax=Streptomyces sp. NPDC020875 TaxID=3154898 RepID=UPI0033E73DFD
MSAAAEAVGEGTGAGTAVRADTASGRDTGAADPGAVVCADSDRGSGSGVGRDAARADADAATRISGLGGLADRAAGSAGAGAAVTGGCPDHSGARAPRGRTRADALRNRERIVRTARDMFTAHGAEVSFDEIARGAGVGNATLYRHFPDRASLVHAVVLSVLDRACAQAERASAEEADPFDAVRRFVHRAADERTGALCPMIKETFDGEHPDLVIRRTRLEATVAAMVERAQTAGRMRHDVGASDLMMAVGLLTRPLPGTSCDSNTSYVHRYLQLFLDGVEAPARSELTGTSITLEDLRNHH